MLAGEATLGELDDAAGVGLDERPPLWRNESVPSLWRNELVPPQQRNKLVPAYGAGLLMLDEHELQVWALVTLEPQVRALTLSEPHVWALALSEPQVRALALPKAGPSWLPVAASSAIDTMVKRRRSIEQQDQQPHRRISNPVPNLPLTQS